jgi:hypothetical protein
MTRHLPLALIALTLATGACTLNADKYPRPRDLSPGWRVDKLRILAIQSEPPEIAPGETAALRALLVDPDETIEATVWVWCPGEVATDFGCPIDPSAFDPDLTPEELAERGVIGVEPFWAPTLTAESAWLDGLDARGRLEGINVTVNALALPGADAGDTDAELDFNQLESAFKRVVVSEATTPNHNPGIADFTVDGVVIGASTVAIVDRGEAYELSVELAADAIETYVFVNSDDEVEERVELPYAEWFATAGSVEEDVTLHPFLPSTWIAPDESGEAGTWWVVLRDRRGGVSWASRSWRVR